MNYRLILVGEGELLEKIKEKSIKLRIADKVNFIGSVQDSSSFYSLFDLMIFPSFFEGLPFTLIEAQAAGVQVIASNNVTKNMNITNTIKYIDLKNNDLYWAKYINNLTKIKDRNILYNKMKNSLFDENSEIKKLEKIYSLNINI